MGVIKKHILLIGFILLLITPVNATHNRAGEITYTWISGYTYQVTITTFTYSPSPANRSELEISWGDNTSDILPLQNGVHIQLPDDYFKNIYIGQHTYAGPGTYELLMQDPNRNAGVVNIPNSVNTIFSIITQLVINPLLGQNSTPILLNYPIDKGAVGQIFIHNPGAYDPDGDSLSYSIDTCRDQNGNVITDYVYPTAKYSLYVDPVKGNFVWNYPESTGNYNVAMRIYAWRDGVIINYVERDMQITILQTNDKNPVIQQINNSCVVAGTLIKIKVITTDPNNNYVTVQAVGGPLEPTFDSAQYRAQFIDLYNQPGIDTSLFTWQTTTNHIRKQPYNIVVTATDQAPDSSNLVDMISFNITVMAPSPILKTITPQNKQISLSWKNYNINKAAGFYIYRRQDEYPFSIDSCIGGVPANSDYVLVGTLQSETDTTFTDNNNQTGLEQGSTYCYVIVAFFPDGSLSYPSNTVCATLKAGLPALINVSVTKDSIHGSIFVSWKKPNLDSIQAPGPFQIKIFRGNNFFTPDTLNPVNVINTASLSDTTYIDSLINTYKFPYSYTIKIYNNTPGNVFQIGEQNEVASSFYPLLNSSNNTLTLKMEKNIPWINTQYIIYRYNKSSQLFDSIGNTFTDSYIDTKLTNDTNYCYKIKSIGYRDIDSTIFNNINWSHINCAKPIDTIPPCSPTISINSQCDSFNNMISWSKPGCANDNYIAKYNIYFSPSIDSAYHLIASVNNSTFTYTDRPKNGLAGCYIVLAVDSSNNISKNNVKRCTDICPLYSLPNVFTPNGDGINDIFQPFPYTDVEKVNMKIFNRWGVMVFETIDPNINWDGKDMHTHQLLPSGVYFYVCDVYEQRLTGIEIRHLNGFIELLSGQVSSPNSGASPTQLNN